MSEKPTILVVDDDPAVRALLRDFFAGEGYVAETAEDGLAALDLFEKAQADVALVDLKMPGIDGVELCRRIKKMYPRTEVIIITAYSSTASAIAAFREGAFDYVLKPLHLMEISHSVEQALGKQQLLTERENLTRSLIRTYAEVRASQNILRIQLDSANRAVLFLELDGTIIGVNGKAKDLFGYSRDEFLKMKLDQLMPQSFSERAREMTKRLRMGLSDSFEAEVCTKHKETLKLELNASVIEQEKRRAAVVFLREPLEEVEKKIKDSEESPCTPNTGS